MKKFIILLLSLSTLSFSSTDKNNEEFSESLPDVTREFDAIVKDTKKTFKKVKKKWDVDEKMIMRDIQKFSTEDIMERSISKYYRDYESWRNIETQLTFLIKYFETDGPGDIKNTVFKKYTKKNGGRVMYKGQEYTVEQLGNIHYGAALKAYGHPREPSVCAGGLYQMYADECIPVYNLKYKEAINRCINKKTGLCMDYTGDSKMIRRGYSKF